MQSFKRIVFLLMPIMINALWMNYLRVAGVTLYTGVLVACHAPANDALNGWMDEVRAQAQRPTVGMTPIASTTPAMQTPPQVTDPFHPEKLTLTPHRLSDKENDLPASPHQKTPLALIPISAMRFVGTISNHHNTLALVQVDATVYQVQVGDYLGQYAGKIDRISEDMIYFTEWRPTAGNQWQSHPNRIALQEGNHE